MSVHLRLQGIYQKLSAPHGISPVRWHGYQIMALFSALFLLLAVPLHRSSRIDTVVQSWHSLIGLDHAAFCLTVLPWLLLGATFLFVMVFPIMLIEKLTLRSRLEKHDFFQVNGDTPLTRAAYKIKSNLSRDPLWVSIGLIGVMYVIMSLYGTISLLGSSPEEMEDALAKYAGFAQAAFWVVCSIVGLLVLSKAACWTFNLVEPTLIRANKWLAHKPTNTLDKQYECLPASEKASLASQAQLLGVNPNDPAIRRVAVADYQARLAAVCKQASTLDHNTAAASTGSDQSIKRL